MRLKSIMFVKVDLKDLNWTQVFPIKSQLRIQSVATNLNEHRFYDSFFSFYNIKLWTRVFN
jgi:hypothetical protein